MPKYLTPEQARILDALDIPHEFILKHEERMQEALEKFQKRKAKDLARLMDWKAQKAGIMTADETLREVRREERAQRLAERGEAGTRRRHRATSERTRAARREQARRYQAKLKERKLAALERHLEIMEEIRKDPDWKPKYMLRIVGEDAFLVDRPISTRELFREEGEKTS